MVHLRMEIHFAPSKWLTHISQPQITGGSYGKHGFPVIQWCTHVYSFTRISHLSSIPTGAELVLSSHGISYDIQIETQKPCHRPLKIVDVFRLPCVLTNLSKATEFARNKKDTQMFCPANRSPRSRITESPAPKTGHLPRGIVAHQQLVGGLSGAQRQDGAHWQRSGQIAWSGTGGGGGPGGGKKQESGSDSQFGKGGVIFFEKLDLGKALTVRPPLGGGGGV